MKKLFVALGLAFIGAILFSIAVGAIKPDDPDILCGFECRSYSCVQDMYVPEDSWCFLQGSEGCFSGRDPEVCGQTIPPGF